MINPIIALAITGIILGAFIYFSVDAILKSKEAHQ